MKHFAVSAIALLAASQDALAFTAQKSLSATCAQKSGTNLAMTTDGENGRRTFLESGMGLMGVAFGLASVPQNAGATVYLDPAMYGDQELRVSAVDSLREAVRRAILQKPSLAPSFYTLALMDGLSFDAKSKEGGPDGRIVREVLQAKVSDDDTFMNNLKEAATTLVTAGKSLRKMTAITVADSVALSGAAAIESIGGPILTTQLGRTDFGKNTGLSVPKYYPPLDLLSGRRPISEVMDAFKKSGLTDREMTAVLSALMTIDTVNKEKAPGDWKKSQRGRFVERGKMGRMSDYKRLTDEDIAEMEEADDDDDYLEDPDDGWYIADTFGSRDTVFGKKVGGEEVTQKNFNKFLKELNEYSAVAVSKKTGITTTKGREAEQPYGWVGDVLLDQSSPGVQSWLAKYAAQPLTYNKDLVTAYNSITQLGGEFTGGKYESLLINKPRKTLNDF